MSSGGPRDGPTKESTGSVARKTGAHPTRTSLSFTDTETKILRKLARVLQKGIEHEDFDDTKDSRSGQEIERPYTVGEYAEEPSDEDKQKQLQDKLSALKFTNLPALKELIKKHNPIRQHVQSLLSALGGGHRTAKALEGMQEGLDELGKSVYMTFFYPGGSVRALRTLQGAVREVSASFEEFGIFNTEFFDSLKALETTSEDIMNRADSEYESESQCDLDEYTDSLFGRLSNCLDRYIQPLTSIAEKEIPAIRQSQDFISQQHVNLTTIATFLSSVTATTLQISTGAPASLLTTVTNTFWFVSLVFSAASAVYSLLEMTWRRSPIRRPDKSLPTAIHAWLRNGPMFSLIVSLLTFSIGLCLLAFIIAEQEGGVAPAAVPTSFAGVHAQVIFFLAMWYLFEYWRTRHPKSWLIARNNPVFKYGECICAHVFYRPFRTKKAKDRVGVMRRLGNRGARLLETLRQLCKRLLHASARRKSDEEELGLHPTSEDHGAPLPNQPGREDSKRSQERAVAATASVSRQDDHPEDDKSEGYDSRPGDLLQFSPDCRLLASAFSGTVTIYNINDSFSVFKTIDVPDASLVRQILWNPGAKFGRPSGGGDLLVRSCRDVRLYSFAGEDSRACRLDNPEDAGQIRWVRKEDTGFDGLSCLVGTSLKIFPLFDSAVSSDHRIEDDTFQTWDLLNVGHGGKFLDAVLYGKDKVICLVRSHVSGELKLKVVNRDTMSIEKTISVDDHLDTFSDRAYISVSQKSGKALIHRNARSDEYDLGTYSHDWHDGRIVGYFGKDDNLVYMVCDESVDIYHSHVHSFFHVISVPGSGTFTQGSQSFAVGHNPERRAPYLFAFGRIDGSVKIWSIQYNRALHYCKSARLFELHDKRYWHSEPVMTIGRFLTLPPPTTAGFSSADAGDPSE